MTSAKQHVGNIGLRLNNSYWLSSDVNYYAKLSVCRLSRRCFD